MCTVYNRIFKKTNSKNPNPNFYVINNKPGTCVRLLLNRKSQFAIADVEFLKVIPFCTFISVSE